MKTLSIKAKLIATKFLFSAFYKIKYNIVVNQNRLSINIINKNSFCFIFYLKEILNKIILILSYF